MNYRYRFVRQGDYVRAIPEAEMRIPDEGRDEQDAITEDGPPPGVEGSEARED